MTGCPVGDAPVGAAQAQAGAEDAGQLLATLEQIERVGRSRPDEYARQLKELIEQTPAGSAMRAEALSLRAMVLAFGRSRAGLDELQAAIASWPNPATVADLRVGLVAAKGRFQFAQGDVREAARALGELDAAVLAKATPRQQIRLLDVRSQVLGEVGQFNEALGAGQAELTLAANLGATWRRATALIDVALCYFRADQMDPARKTHAEAMALALKDPDPVLMYTVFNIRGVLYGKDTNGQIAQDSFMEALRYAEEAGDDSQRALVLGNLADMALTRHQYAEALKMAEQVLPLARKTRRLVAEIGARHNAGLAKIALGRIAEGREDVRVAITMDEQNGSATYAAQDWEELGQYLERAGDFAGAIDAYHEHRRAVDRLLRDDTRKAVVEAQEHFEAERRAAEIELLNRDNSLKAERIRARNLQLGLWASLGACAVLAGVLLVLAYQRVRKTNTALAATNDLLKMQSERDPLTGLANRRYFQAAIKALAREEEGGRLSGAVFLIDIDHFKRVNDQYGHAIGDSVLIEVARRLRAALREDDLIVRWGGEEFLVVVKGDVDEDDEPARDDGNIARPFVDSRALNPGSAQTLAQRMLDLIGTEPVRHEDRLVPVTASIGFASFPIEPYGLSLAWERAIDLVDTVMYIAKAHGRNKAYGIAHIEARDEEQVAAIAPRMEAAWQAGQVRLLALQGPEAAETPVTGEVPA
ncbi:MAG: GGDEF domain-containing protein [Paucibacter sp.]|nr:GGDEF domain-containing protein [Roseateles sp.]